jgi:Bacterial Ig-like domain (group 2)/Galactose oxidase, central domain/Kelch motif
MLRIERRTGSLALIASGLFRDDRIGSCLAKALLLIATLTLPGCGGGGTRNSPPPLPPPPNTLVSIAVTLNNSNIPLGLTQQLKATGTFSDASTTDLTSTANWTSSQPAFVTVGAASGVATSVALGSAVITATSGSTSGSATLTATPAVIESIAISPNPAILGIILPRQLVATGKYSDGTTADVTTKAIWTSSTPTVATVGPTTGLTTGVSLGSGTVSATIGSVSQTEPLSVVTWTPTGSMSAPRVGHTATPLTNGKILVVGGSVFATNDGCPPVGTHESSELYDPVSGTWSPTGNLSSVGCGSTATRLANGQVLVAGGNEWGTVAAELYDPISGTWSPTGSMSTPRVGHTSTLLPNGMVLVTGGLISNYFLIFQKPPGSADDSITGSAELFDPSSGTWAAIASMSTPRLDHTAVLLPDGKVLVAGGKSVYPDTIGLTSAEIYDPAAGTWSPAGTMSTPRSSHTATLLTNGTVLVSGGGASQGTTHSSAEIYDPVAATWSVTGSLATARYIHTASLLTDGKVLVAGGINYLQTALGPTMVFLASAELYDPASGTWSSAGSMSVERFSHTQTSLPDGSVLVVGGETNGAAFASAELYWE